MNDRVAVEKLHGGHEAILELLLGGDADVAQDGAGELGKEALDEIEPGTVLMPVRLSANGALNRRCVAMSCSRICLGSI